MLGYRVALLDGTSEVVEASGYDIDDDGGLVLTLDGQAVRSWRLRQWITVDEVGTRIAAEWPAPGLRDVLETLLTILAVKYGYYVHHVGDESKYSSEVFNEVDALAGAVLAAVGIDPRSTDDADRISEVRQAVAQAFDVRVPIGRVQPSGMITSFHCPRCSDVLRINSGGLMCPTANMGFSRRVAEAIRAFGEAPPNPGADRTTSATWEGLWFCPGDGMRLDSSPGLLPACWLCQRTLPGDLIDLLIDFRHHGPLPGEVS